MIITGIQDAQTPFADILSTAQSLGIRHYRNSAYYRYDYAKPLAPQIEALTPRLASLIPLNQRYRTLLCYHTRHRLHWPGEHPLRAQRPLGTDVGPGSRP